MNHQLWIATRSAKPPKEPVTPELQEARRRWYAQNPWRPDWETVAVMQKAAHICIRDAEQ